MTVIAAVAAPSAWANSADLDASFGSNGIAMLGLDKHDPQKAPLQQSDGKIIAAGLLQNSSDRVFLSRLLSSGALDPTYGGGDSIHTGVVAAPARRAAVAIGPDDKLTVVGGSSSAGRLTIERYNPDGTIDGTLGTNGRITVDIGGTYAIATGAVAQAAGKTLVSVATDAGSHKDLVVIGLNNKGLDATFGVKGIARAAFGSRQAAANDLVVLSNGAIVLAGSVQDAGSTTNVDTALARFTAAGVADATFGSTGKVTTDAAGNQTSDYAVAIVNDPTGALFVTGPTPSGDAFVARYTSTGALDGSFGTGGIKFGGLRAAGTTLVPSDIARDLSGRLLVSGTTAQGVAPAITSRWTVVRLNASGASPVDTSFGSGGQAFVAPCDNSSGFGATGVAVTAANRILVQGACGSAGIVTVVRLFGNSALSSAPGFTVSPATQAAGHERIRLSQIDPSALFIGTSALQSASLRSGSLRSGSLRSGSLRSGPLDVSPLVDASLRSGSLRSGLLTLPLPLSSVTLLNGKTWEELLVGTGLTGPLQTITLQQVLALNPLPAQIAALTVADIDFGGTAAGRYSLAAFLLGGTPISHLPGNVCGAVSGQPKNCTNSDPNAISLLALEIAGDDLGSYYAQPIALDHTNDLGSGVDAAPLAQIKLKHVELSLSPAGSVKASEVSTLLTCGANCTGTLATQQAADPSGFSEATIGDLLAKLPVPSLSKLTVGGIIAGLLSADEIPYENSPLATLLDAADLRPDHLQTYTVDFDLDCAQAAGLKIAVTLPGNARIAAGSSTATVGSAAANAIADPARDPANANNPTYGLNGELNTICGTATGVQHVTVRFSVEPGSTLEQVSSSVAVSTPLSGGAKTATAPGTVDDSLDQAGDAANATPITTDRIYAGHIAYAGDVDDFSFASPPAGSRVTVTLSHLPADFDLQVYGAALGVPTSSLRSGSLRSGLLSASLRSGPVEDTTEEPIAQDATQPNGLQDLSLRSGSLRSGSINRGTHDESSTFVVRTDDVGKSFTVQVAGYNGAHDKEPYVMRVKVAAAPPTPPCITRSRLNTGAPGTFPSLPLATDTQTLILVNRKRTASRYGDAKAQAMMSKLATLAGLASVKGVVVPVESDPTVDTGTVYNAWDDDVCSVPKINAVADKINAVIDHVRKDLPDLRNIVIVGADDMIPQVRIPDYTVVSNEFDAANSLAFNGKDNAVSRSMRENNVLTDTAYGDFDPATWRGSSFYVPDVAIGRVVETPDDAIGQVDQYIAAGGRLDPSSTRVSGYDFVTDSAQAIAAAFGATARVNNWTASDAQSDIDNATPGFISINGHYDQYRGQAANGSLFSTAGRTPAAGSFSITIGCHAGLNADDVLIAGSDPRTADWPQLWSSHKDLYVGNTGFGYGDTDLIAYSERLNTFVAQNIASGNMTAGQALMFAQQQYASPTANGTGIADDYDAKTLEQLTYYGLPMYVIGASGVSAPAALPEGPRSPQTLSLRRDPFHVTPALTRVDTSRGTYWRSVGIFELQHHAVEPRTFLDVTNSDGFPVHGLLIEAQTTQDIAVDDVRNLAPTSGPSVLEPELSALSGFFPTNVQTLNRTATPSGFRDTATFVVGQTRRGIGEPKWTQRLYTDLSGESLRSNSNDWKAPQLVDVIGNLTGDASTGQGVSFSIETCDSDVAGGVILYRTDASDAWRSINVTRQSACLVGGGDTVPAGTTAVRDGYIQIYDTAGNVALTSLKGVGHVALPAPQGDLKFVLNPAPPASRAGYYAASPSITIDPGSHAGVRMLVSIDGGPQFNYTGAFSIPVATDEGDHTLDVVGADGSSGFARLSIDHVKPLITGQATSSPNADGWYNDNVTVHFDCIDDVSGVASCTPDTSVGEGANQTVTGNAADRATNTALTTVGPLNVDKTKPTVVITSSGALQLGGQLQGTISDSLSGSKKVVVTYTHTLVGQDKTVTAVVTCNLGPTKPCTWKADLPTTGTYNAVAVGTDVADNDAISNTAFISVS